MLPSLLLSTLLAPANPPAQTPSVQTPPAQTPRAQFAAEPHFIVLPGIEGSGLPARGMVSGLRQSRPGASHEVFDWTTGRPVRMFYHLRAWKRNQGMASVLANHIVALQMEQPGRPIVLVGHSGGSAVIVSALEQLPPQVKVHQAILLAPALSPSYSLDVALDRTVNGIDVFHSRADWLFQGAGSTIAGTMDRAHVAGAGMVGFQVPGNSDAKSQLLYATKLRQHGYVAGIGHYTSTLPPFVARYVSPEVR